MFGWCQECGGELKEKEYWNEDDEGQKIFITAGQDHLKGNTYDPCHGTGCMLEQMYGPGGYKAPGGKPTGVGYIKGMGVGKNITEKESYFQYFDAATAIPNLYKLAKNYVVLARWYAGLPGATGPNRLFAACSSSGGYAGGNYQPGAYGPVPLPSIYETLSKNSTTWKIYEDDRGPHGLGTVRSLKWVQSRPENVLPFESFHGDIENNKLAAYTWLIPDLSHGKQNSLHPGTAHGSMVPGDTLVGEVFAALEKNHELFSKTAFLIVFDEAGGFWDSRLPQGLVSAPEVTSTDWWPSDGAKVHFDFRTRGPRVPAILVHPHLGHHIDLNVYEHSSIPKTIRELFAPDSPPHSVRESECGNFLKNNGFKTKQ